MPTPTYTALANITLGSSAASVTFSSISQAYRDLVLVVNGKSGTSFAYRYIRINNDSGANYNEVQMKADGSTASSNSTSGQSYFDPWIFTNSTVNDATIINFFDYSATDKHKNILIRHNHTNANVTAYSGRWASTTAITSIKIYADGTNTFAAGTVMAIYGIAS